MSTLKNKLNSAVGTIRRQTKKGILIGSGVMAMSGAACTHDDIESDVDEQIKNEQVQSDTLLVISDRDSKDFGQIQYNSKEVKKIVFESTQQKNMLDGLVRFLGILSGVSAREGAFHLENLKEVDAHIYPTNIYIDSHNEQIILELARLARLANFNYLVDNGEEYAMPKDLKIGVKSNITSIELRTKINDKRADDIQLLQAWGIVFDGLNLSPELQKILDTRKNPYIGKIKPATRSGTMPAAMFMEMMKNQNAGK